MFSDFKINWNKQRVQQLTDLRNISLFLFVMIVLAMTWSGVKTVQNNYELQKKISVLKQQNNILQLENENKTLQNKYLETDQYLELTARRSLGLASPGEKVLIIPKEVALKYVSKTADSQPGNSPTSENSLPKSKYAKNLEAWRNFLLGRQVVQD